MKIEHIAMHVNDLKAVKESKEITFDKGFK